MKLYRYSHRTPNFEDFNRMTKELEEFIRSDFSDEWPERLAEIQRFQTEDGGFAYVDDWRIESDARVEFCYKPTYLCTAILMKASIVRLLSQDVVMDMKRKKVWRKPCTFSTWGLQGNLLKTILTSAPNSLLYIRQQ